MCNLRLNETVYILFSFYQDQIERWTFSFLILKTQFAVCWPYSNCKLAELQIYLDTYYKINLAYYITCLSFSIVTQTKKFSTFSASSVSQMLSKLKRRQHVLRTGWQISLENLRSRTSTCGSRMPTATSRWNCSEPGWNNCKNWDKLAQKQAVGEKALLRY